MVGQIEPKKLSGNASLNNKTNTLNSSEEFENFLWNTTKFLPWTISLVHFFFFPWWKCSFFIQRLFLVLNSITSSFFKEFFNGFLYPVVDKNEWMNENAQLFYELTSMKFCKNDWCIPIQKTLKTLSSQIWRKKLKSLLSKITLHNF